MIINYGTEILLEFFIKVFVLISVAIICSKTIETVIFYWYFQLLQKNSK
ncbi:accessory gene regulator B family protein [Blautia hansenii]